MPIILAALSALSYGAADFLGGVAARKSRAYIVLFWSQLVGLSMALVVALIAGAGEITVVDLFWGAAAGLAGAVGIMILYRALAETVAAVCSPTAAVIGAVFPVLVGLSLGEHPEPIAWIGVASAIPAILLLTWSRGGADGAVLRALRLGLLAGMGFGLFFVCISRTHASSGLWPLVAARAASIVPIVLIALFTRRSLKVDHGSGLAVTGAGILDMAANIFYLVASHSGLLILVTVVAALYPAPTVVLSRIVYRERLGVARIAGLLLAIAGMALIGVGQIT